MKPFSQQEIDSFALGVVLSALAFLFDWDLHAVHVAMINATREREDEDLEVLAAIGQLPPVRLLRPAGDDRAVIAVIHMCRERRAVATWKRGAPAPRCDVCGFNLDLDVSSFEDAWERAEEH